MMLLAMVLAGALGGTGVLLLLRGAVGTTTPLETLVAELHRPRGSTADADSDSRRLIEQLAGHETSDRESDLVILERSLDKYVQDRFTWALLGASPGLTLVLLATTGTIALFPNGVLLLAGLVGAAAGWLYARVDMHSDAERARGEFRHALSAYLELVAILMAGGAGVETAVFDAATAGHGSPFRHIRSALTAAQTRRHEPWLFFGDLGTQLGVSELIELHSSMTLAGDGAQVRNSLVSMAAGMRRRDLAQIETQAQSKSEAMVLPVALMFAGFLVLIGYPALAALSTT